jgi:hypothetical protein
MRETLPQRICASMASCTLPPSKRGALPPCVCVEAPAAAVAACLRLPVPTLPAAGLAVGILVDRDDLINYQLVQQVSAIDC